MLASTDVPVLERHDCLFLDIDGVIHRSHIPIRSAVATVRDAQTAGLGVHYLTNNASRTPEDVCRVLTDCGLDVDPSQVVTSALAIADLMARELPPGAPVFVVGDVGLERALLGQGLEPVRDAAANPLAAVQGHSTHTSWTDLADLSRLVQDGVPWFASNRDYSLPTSYGVAPGNGAFVSMIQELTGASPRVAGKPFPLLFDYARRSSGAQRPLMVGDRLDTDIEGARCAGIASAWVGTGVHDLSDVIRAVPSRRPDLVLADMRGLLRAQPVVDVDVNAARCGEARVRWDVDGFFIERPGRHPEEALRAAAILGWILMDASGIEPEIDARLGL